MSDPFSLERQPSNRPPTDLAPVSPDFFEIQVANRPVPVRIEYSAIRELHRQLASEGESVGLLLGTSTAAGISIQRCEVVAVSPGATGDPKLLLGAFRQSIEARGQTHSADAAQLLGCFRTQVAGWPGMKETDLGMVKRALPGSDSFFVLIRTTSHRPWLAALYALDAKTTTTSVEPALEFPFDEYLLRKGYLTDLVEAPDPVEVQEPPKKNKTPWIIGGVIAAVLLAGSAAAYKWKSSRSAEETDVATKSAPKPALNLKVNRSGKDFEVSWDRLSAAVQQATGGMLTITDGALTRPVALNGSQLREGRILYTPLFEELNFRLEVMTPDSGTAAESVQVLAWSGKQPADVLTAAPTNPLTNLPPRTAAASPTPTPASPKPAAPIAKSLPAPVVNNLKQQTQPAKQISTPATVAVNPPSPSNSAPAVPARIPETPVPAVAPERPVVAQPSPQVPANTTPSQPPVAPAPKPEPAPAKQSVPATPPVSQPGSTNTSAITPTIPSSASTPAPAGPISSGRTIPPAPIQRVAATMPRNLPAGVPRVVSVRVMVDSSGSVQSAEVTASSPKGAFGEALMKSAALDAAKKWKFQPGQLNGKSVAAEYSIDFKF